MSKSGRLKKERSHCKLCGKTYPQVEFYDQFEHPSKSQSWSISCQQLTNRVMRKWEGHRHGGHTSQPMSTVPPSRWSDSFVRDVQDLIYRQQFGESMGTGGVYMREATISRIVQIGAATWPSA